MSPSRSSRSAGDRLPERVRDLELLIEVFRIRAHLRTALLSNYPNPFNPTTTIAFEIPTRTQVSLRVYDVSGRLVQILEDSEIEAGRHTAVWDGKDRDGKSVASGVYFCRLEAGSVTDTRTMVLLK